MNKQIEEMARKICWFKCPICVKTCDYFETAETLYNAGYRKVNDDEVVISKEEYENLQIAKDFDYGYHEGEANMTAYYENIKLPETRKETARKILQKADIMFKAWAENKLLEARFVDEVKELKQIFKKIIAEKYGIEVEW